MDPLVFLTKITLVLFIGLLMGLISKRLRLPSMLLLILTGVLLNNMSLAGQPILDFNDQFLVTASIVALVMIVFKDSSQFTIRDLHTYSGSALRITVMVLALNFLFLSIAIYMIFGLKSIMLSFLFAAVMSGTDPGAVLSLFQTKSNKITDILKFESVINTPIIVLIPFIIIDWVELETSLTLGDSIVPFFQQIITGIGTGVFVGIIIFRFMRRFYSEKLSPFTLVTAALLTYVLAENIGGNGVLAITVLGIFFGNVTVKKKPELQEFSTMLSNVLEILVFMLIGFLIPLNLDPGFLLKSILLFVIMVFLRFVAMQLVFMHDHTNIKERIFMSLNCTKGIAVAVVAFILSSRIMLVESVVLDLMVLFIIYSIMLSSVAARYSQYFIRLKVEE